MICLGQGVTRTVWRVGSWAVKVPGGLACKPGWRPVLWPLVRGWLANRSEWQQRWRATVNRPVWTVGYVLQGYRVAELASLGDPEWHARRVFLEDLHLYSDEELKHTSWGKVDGHWVLLDFDRCWEPPRGWVGGVYWWRQERLGRKWSKL